MVLLVLLIALLVDLSSSACTTITAFQPTDYTTAMDCLNSIAFSDATRKTSLEVLQNFYTLYVFRPFYESESVPSYNLTVNLPAALAALSTKSYSSKTMYDFYKDLQYEFMKLYDRQTIYSPPPRFSAMTFLQPFGVSRDGAGKFFVASHASVGHDKYAEYYEIGTSNAGHTTLYTGDEILSIDGVSPEQYFGNLSLSNPEASSYSRDPSVRYNDLLRNYGVKTLSFHHPPTAGTVTYELLAMGTISPPWVAVSSVGFSSGSRREAEDQQEEDVEVMVDTEKKTPLEMGDLYTDALLTGSPLGLRRQTDTVTSYRRAAVELGSRPISFNSSYMPGTLVIQVGDFPSFDVDAGKAFVETVVTEFGSLPPLYQKVIIDVRGASAARGGECSAYLLARHISPFTPIRCSPNMDMIYSELGYSMYCGGYYAWDRFESFDENGDTASVYWYSTTRTVPRNSSSTEYSQLVHHECAVEYFTRYFSSQNYWKNPAVNPNWDPQDVYVLTDGTCGGACGLFINLVKYLHLGRIVSIGGLPGSPPAISSYQGSLSFSLDDAVNQYDDRDWVCGTIDGLFEKLPNGATASVSYFELWPWDPLVSAFELSKAKIFTDPRNAIPLELIRSSADFHLDRYDLKSDLPYYGIQTLYNAQTCSWWEVKRNLSATNCPYLRKEHAVYGNPCSATIKGTTGVWDYSQCITRHCEPGYYLNDADVCVVMPEEYVVAEALVTIITIVVAVVIAVPTAFIFGSLILFVAIAGVVKCVNVAKKKQWRGAAVGSLQAMNQRLKAQNGGDSGMAPPPADTPDYDSSGSSSSEGEGEYSDDDDDDEAGAYGSQY